MRWVYRIEKRIFIHNGMSIKYILYNLYKFTIFRQTKVTEVVYLKITTLLSRQKPAKLTNSTAFFEKHRCLY